MTWSRHNQSICFAYMDYWENFRLPSYQSGIANLPTIPLK